MVYCEFKKYGCIETCKLENIEKHLTECDYFPERIVDCENGCGCKFKLNEKTVSLKFTDLY